MPQAAMKLFSDGDALEAARAFVRIGRSEACTGEVLRLLGRWLAIPWIVVLL